MKYSIRYVLKRILDIVKNALFYSHRFGHFGLKSCMRLPLQLEGCENIFIGNVSIGYKVWLAAMPLTDASECKLIIKDGCRIGNFNHIYATGELVIEANVLTADKVYISDNLHGYDDISLPIYQQPIKQKGHVTIGEGSWLGENVCVVGASVGKHCVIGANSVVVKDIPDYSVAVGIPAKVVKQYNFEQKKWLKC